MDPWDQSELGEHFLTNDSLLAFLEEFGIEDYLPNDFQEDLKYTTWWNLKNTHENL